MFHINSPLDLQNLENDLLQHFKLKWWTDTSGQPQRLRLSRWMRKWRAEDGCCPDVTMLEVALNLAETQLGRTGIEDDLFIQVFEIVDQVSSALKNGEWDEWLPEGARDNVDRVTELTQEDLDNGGALFPPDAWIEPIVDQSDEIDWVHEGF